MAKKKAKRPRIRSVHRTDLLASNLTASKEAALIEVVRAWRKGAVLLATEQWRFFFETGRLRKNNDNDKQKFSDVIGAANRVQMCRWHVVGQLQSWISNRANEFREMVKHSSLDDDTKHMLHTVNVLGVWFGRETLVMRESGIEVPETVRRLGRQIMRQCMSKHRKPDLSRSSMRLDSRAGSIGRPVKATQKDKIGWWLKVSVLAKGRKIAVPLLNNEFHAARSGRITNGVQVNLRDGKLTFGVVTDMTESSVVTRREYDGKGAISLDFGLATLFGTSEGQLLGQGWLKQLRRYDALITVIAASQQRAGKKPRDSKRYCALVQDVRGFLRTEIGRILNRLVADRKPRELVVEALDFRHSELSKRLNAIMRNCGRSLIKAKLTDFEDRLGIKITEVNPAYSSQSCACCGYVDKRNRTRQKDFRCLWCGHKTHADLNAASNIKARRARPAGWLSIGKVSVLAELVREFGERSVRGLRSGKIGSRGAPADPRLTNPYFNKATKARAEVKDAVMRIKIDPTGSSSAGLC